MLLKIVRYQKWEHSTNKNRSTAKVWLVIKILDPAAVKLIEASSCPGNYFGSLIKCLGKAFSLDNHELLSLCLGVDLDEKF